ncbi:hypothetical protein, partial [Lactococcus petauri]|uniref:hypothetical protein n=1 Tax=Lactococcus petauri TaxID=1940789 RepID=UPI0021F20276
DVWIWGAFQDFIYLKAVLKIEECGESKILGLHMFGEKSSEFIMVFLFGKLPLFIKFIKYLFFFFI